MKDDILTLYYYNDGLSIRERRDVAAALRDDPVIAARYARIRADLDQWRETDTEPAPNHMVHRWHDSIDNAARRELAQGQAPDKPFNMLSFFWGAAITAALAVGIGIGVIYSGGDARAPAIDTGTANLSVVNDDAIPAAFTRGLQVHLRDTQDDIDSLPVKASADRTLLVMQIIQQNRLFERVAEQNDSESLARVLRAFEPILLRLAADDIAPEDADRLRDQLAFELSVMLTILERDASKKTHST